MLLRRAAWAAFFLLLFLIALVAAAGAWLLYSPSGLQWLAARGGAWTGDALRIEGVAGALARGASAERIRFATDDLSVEVRDARFQLSAASLVTLAPRIEQLHAQRVEIVTKPSDEPRSPLPDSIALPVNLAIEDARIGKLVFDNGANVFDLDNVHLRYAGGRQAHRIEELSLSVLGHAVALRGAIDAQKPFGLRAHVAAVRPADPAAQVAGTLSGNLLEIALDAHASTAAGAKATAQATIRPEDEQPLAAVKLQAQDIEPQAFDSSLPQAALSVELALRRQNGQLQGPLVVRNQIPGPIDRNRIPLAALQADLVTNLSTVGFSALRADLGAAGSITGSGTVQGEEALLELATKGFDLRGVYSTLRATALAGKATMRLTPEQQSVQAELAQDDIRLALEAERQGDAVRIPVFRAQARGGVAKGQAQIDLGGQRPFALQAELQGFDPSAWGDFPDGSINATLQAKGVAQEPAGEVTFVVRDSRWLGAPLSGKGTIRGNTQRITQADVDLALGGNRVSAQGAFGAKGDTLRARFDAPQLALIDKQLQGRLRGTAEVSGTFQTPSIALDATGANLSYAQYGSIDALQIDGRGSLDLDAPLAVRATVAGVKTPQISLRSVKLNAEGNRKAHTATLEALGDPIALRVRVRGGLEKDNSWRGTLLELTNRGEVPIALAQPVDLRVAPGSVQVEPFELQAVGGRLSVRALDYSKERLRTEGSFQSLPVARLIALASKQAPVRGSLRLSGAWDLTSSPELRGSVKIARESGDLLIGEKQPLDIGLKVLSANADVSPERIAFEAAVETALASASGRGRVGASPGGGAIPYAASSPLEFTASIDIARLAPLAEEFIDTALLVGGEVQARLQGSGTLGDPQITGKVTASDLSLALPAEGVSFTNGTLSAVLAPETIRLETFSIRGGQGVLTAEGTFDREGFNRAAVGWRAERFTALGRPDRKLIVSGQGSASLENKRVALKGNLRVDEGEFEIGESPMPTLSSDVVIAGRKPATEPAAARFENFALDLNLDLGKDMHVSGSGLSIWLSGDLRVFTSPQGELRATGTVRVRNGTFEAYGQRLVIDRGNIYFNGPITDPALDIVAMRKRQAVEAGVALTGTLRNPLVRVVSDPPVPQGEALSWLILGRAPGEAGAGELSALPLAGNLLLGKATSPVKGALKLDELSVGNNAAGQFLTLGKRLTDRLYLVFEQGLGVAETLLRLEYSLTQRISLRLQAGEPSGGGIFYRRRWD